MEVYKSKYMLLEYWEEYNLIELTWLPETENKTEEEYKEELLNYLECCIIYKPTGLISDTREYFFTVSIELQEWTNTTVFTRLLELGLSRVAFVRSPELIAQLSIEQTLEENEGSKFTTQYFDNKESAKEWIIS
ncbi:hypothetical protein WAF17_06650 [Bernardetia sp. ABR2-2B]|uniref:hypothetical protein n=1 Tax=Bernardetia sp. ABR2-2B TaxID=3127472 RepID=UPI0030D4E2B2